MIPLEITPRLERLLSENVISIGAHITGEGQNVWVCTLQPHPRLGVKTSDIMTVDEAEERLAKLDRPTVATIDIGLGGVSLRRETPPETDRWTRSSAAAAAPKTITRGGVVNSLPIDSLCQGDFGLSMFEFQARARVVAERLGHAKLVSRIRAAPTTMGIVGTTTLGEWWDRAHPSQRFQLLTTRKKSGEFKDIPNGGSKMAALQRPFLDSPNLLSSPVAPQGAPEEEAFSEGAHSD